MRLALAVVAITFLAVTWQASMASAEPFVGDGRFPMSVPRLLGTSENRVVLTKLETPGEFATLTFPVADVNTVWTINSGNAASFGADWQSILAWAEVDGNASMMTWKYADTPVIYPNGTVQWESLQVSPEPQPPFFEPRPIVPPHFLASFDIESISFDYRFANTNPTVSLRWSATGSGVVAPEPASALLLLLGSCLLGFRHHSSSI